MRSNNGPVLDVASKSKSGDFDDGLEHEDGREEEVKDLQSKVQLLNTTSDTVQFPAGQLV